MTAAQRGLLTTNQRKVMDFMTATLNVIPYGKHYKYTVIISNEVVFEFSTLQIEEFVTLEHPLRLTLPSQRFLSLRENPESLVNSLPAAQYESSDIMARYSS
jgi:hypothetical protein